MHWATTNTTTHNSHNQLKELFKRINQTKNTFNFFFNFSSSTLRNCKNFEIFPMLIVHDYKLSHWPHIIINSALEMILEFSYQFSYFFNIFFELVSRITKKSTFFKIIFFVVLVTIPCKKIEVLIHIIYLLYDFIGLFATILNYVCFFFHFFWKYFIIFLKKRSLSRR